MLFKKKTSIFRNIQFNCLTSFLVAEYIVDRILEIRDNNLDFSDFSILTRASWHSNYVQAELIKRKIPFIVVGGIKFSERRHIKDIIAFLKITINPIDAIA